MKKNNNLDNQMRNEILLEVYEKALYDLCYRKRIYPSGLVGMCSSIAIACDDVGPRNDYDKDVLREMAFKPVDFFFQPELEQSYCYWWPMDAEGFEARQNALCLLIAMAEAGDL